MEFEIIIRTSGLSEREIADLRQRAGRRAAELRAERPNAKIFLVEISHTPPSLNPPPKRLEVKVREE